MKSFFCNHKKRLFEHRLVSRTCAVANRGIGNSAGKPAIGGFFGGGLRPLTRVFIRFDEPEIRGHVEFWTAHDAN